MPRAVACEVAGEERFAAQRRRGGAARCEDAAAATAGRSRVAADRRAVQGKRARVDDPAAGAAFPFGCVVRDLRARQREGPPRIDATGGVAAEAFTGAILGHHGFVQRGLALRRAEDAAAGGSFELAAVRIRDQVGADRGAREREAPRVIDPASEAQARVGGDLGPVERQRAAFVVDAATPERSRRFEQPRGGRHVGAHRGARERERAVDDVDAAAGFVQFSARVAAAHRHVVDRHARAAAHSDDRARRRGAVGPVEGR